MSIVEKALKKLQGEQVSRPRRPTPAVPVAIAPAPVKHEAARTIQVDLERLRSRGMIAPAEESRQLIEQYRRIKLPVLDAAFGRGTPRLERGNLVMVASSMPNDGKTFTAVNLALSIALERDCSVVLVDADVIKTHVSHLFGVQEQPGLIDVLQDGQGRLSDVILATDIDGLEIVSAGRRSPHAPELFASRRMEDLLVEHSERFPDRVMLFDSSPVLATNEALVLARLVGQVLLVVRADQTPQGAVLESLKLLEGSRSISCVLNDARGGPGSDYYGAYHHNYDEHHPPG